MDLKDLVVLEWSRKQNAFHIQPARYAVESNLNALLDNDANDYIPIMIGSREDCDKVASIYRGRLIEREKRRVASR